MHGCFLIDEGLQGPEGGQVVNESLPTLRFFYLDTTSVIFVLCDESIYFFREKGLLEEVECCWPF